MELDHEKLKTLINQASRNIVQDIILDLEPRGGFGREFTHSSDHWKSELRAEWREIAKTALAQFGLEVTKLILAPIQETVKQSVDGPPDGESGADPDDRGDWEFQKKREKDMGI